MAPKNKVVTKPTKPTIKAAGVKAPVAPIPVTIVSPTPEEPVPVPQPNPEPPPRPPDPPKAAEPMKGLTPDEERVEIEKQILSLQARLWELDHPFSEFPKMVKGVTFNTREEQDKAGKEYADKK